MSVNSFWFTVLLLAISPYCAWTQAASPLSESMQPREKSKLIVALSSDDAFVRRRAIQELQAQGSSDNETLRAVLEVLHSERLEIESPDLCELLSACIPQNPAIVANELRSLDGEAAVVLCCAIGKSKNPTAVIINGLKAKAIFGYPSNKVSIIAKAALANLEIDRDANILSLRTALEDRVSLSAPIYNAMLWMGLGSWSSTYLKSSIEDAISRGDERAILASLIAASWGENGRFALPLIQQNTRSMPEEGGIPLAFAQARLVGYQTNWLRSEVVALLGDHRTAFDRGVAAFCILISGTLVNSSTVPQLQVLLQSNDPAVVCGTARICWAVGIPVQPVEKRLVILAQKSPNDDVRLAAAIALGSLGSPSNVPILESAAARETREIVKDSIANAVGIIQLRSQSQLR